LPDLGLARDLRGRRVFGATVVRAEAIPAVSAKSETASAAAAGRPSQRKLLMMVSLVVSFIAD